MELPRAIRIAKKEPEAVAGEVRDFTLNALETAVVIGIAYTLVWWVCILFTMMGWIAALISLIVLNLIAVSVLTPINLGLALGDLLQDFLPFKTKKIPTSNIVELLAVPLVIGHIPFLVVLLFGIQDRSLFLKLAAATFLLSIAVGYSSHIKKQGEKK